MINSESNRKSLNLVIAIGLKHNSKTLGFVAYRYHQKPLSLLRIENSDELPDWGLDTKGEFTDGLNSGNFWPKSLFSDESNREISGPQIKNFNYFSPKRMFVMHMNSETDDSHSYSVKYIESDGQLTDWLTIDLQMDSKQWNKNCLKLFEVNESLFGFCQTEDNVIDFEMSLTQKNRVSKLSAKPMVSLLSNDCKKYRLN